MAVSFPRDPLLRGVRAVLYPVGEFVHVSAIYLGLAVLTTLGLSLTLPSMRQQSQQLHDAVLAMFQAGGEGYSFSDDTSTAEWSVPLAPAEPPPEAPGPVASARQVTPPGTAPPTASGSNASSAAASGSGAPSSPGATPQPGVAGQAGHAKAAGTPPGTAKAAGAQVRTAPQESAGQGARIDADLLGFTQALLASMRDKPVEGLTRSQDHALRSYLARKYKIAPNVAGALVRTAFSVGRAVRVDPQLLLAVIAIESRYNPFLESAAGAQGLMQVMASVHDDKLRAKGGMAAVFNPVVNIQVGAQILADCIRRRGSVAGGLACYVGASGPGDGGYGDRVLAERRRIALASGVPPDKG